MFKRLNEKLEKFILNETYINLFSEQDKEKYKEEVYNLFQDTYKDIGGLKGSGFTSPDDMVKTFPMWKLNRKNGKIIFAAVYKDKNGRKCCAGAQDKSKQGLMVFKDFLKAELSTGRSWTEISGPVLKLAQKWFPELLEQIRISPETMKNIDNEVEIVSDKSYTRPLGNGERVEKQAFGKMFKHIH